MSFRPSLVYFRILYIVQCLLTWWIKKILARGRMSHSDTSLWERKKENPQISLSIRYLEWIQHFNWWLSTDKLSLQAPSSHLVLSTLWLVEGSVTLLPWETCSYDVISILIFLFVTTFRKSSRFPSLPILLSKQTKGGGGRRRRQDWKSFGTEKRHTEWSLWRSSLVCTHWVPLRPGLVCHTAAPPRRMHRGLGLEAGLAALSQRRKWGTHGSHKVSQQSYWKIIFEVVWGTCQPFSCKSHRNDLAAFFLKVALSNLLPVKSLSLF